MVPEVPPHHSSAQPWAGPVAPGDILGVKLTFEAAPDGEAAVLPPVPTSALFVLCGFMFKDSKFSFPSDGMGQAPSQAVSGVQHWGKTPRKTPQAGTYAELQGAPGVSALQG